MKVLKVISIMIYSVFFFSATALGHSSHSHGAKKEVSEIKIKAVVLSNVSRLVANKKLEDSWKKAEIKSLIKKKFGPNEEWVATLENSSTNDKEKATLYVFVNLFGDFIAANFTGK